MTLPGFDPASYDITIDEARRLKQDEWADVVEFNAQIDQLVAKIANMEARLAAGDSIDPAVIDRSRQKLRDLKAARDLARLEWRGAKSGLQQAKKARQDAKRAARDNYQRYEVMASSMMPWLPAELIDVWATSWAEYGDSQIALAMVRDSDLYDTLFPGIKRDDGSLRMDERTYLGTLAGYRDALSEFGVNPANFESLFITNIAGDVSSQEFRQRVTGMHERIVAREPQLADIFVDYFGGMGDEATKAGLLAMALDPSVNLAVLERRISVAEIGGAAAIRGYGIGLDLATRLHNQGVDLAGGRQLFMTAAQLLRSISSAGRRNLEGSVSITDFVEAQGLGEAEDVARLSRITQREGSRFTEQTAVRGDENQALTGLRPR